MLVSQLGKEKNLEILLKIMFNVHKKKVTIAKKTVCVCVCARACVWACVCVNLYAWSIETH